VGNVTSWVYDAHNRVTEETNELLDTRYFEYDDAGNLTEKTDRNGLVTQFTYDNLYRLTQEVWLDGMTTVNTLDFTYDAAGQMTSASDDNSSYDYTYDGLGRVTYEEIDNGGPLVNFTQACGPNPAFDRGAPASRLFPLTEARRHRDRKENFFAEWGVSLLRASVAP
jgi:YD repeat-containing protein